MENVVLGMHCYDDDIDDNDEQYTNTKLEKSYIFNKIGFMEESIFMYCYDDDGDDDDDNGTIHTLILLYCYGDNDEQCNNKTLPKAQRAQGIDSVSWV